MSDPGLTVSTLIFCLSFTRLAVSIYADYVAGKVWSRVLDRDLLLAQVLLEEELNCSLLEYLMMFYDLTKWTPRQIYPMTMKEQHRA